MRNRHTIFAAVILAITASVGFNGLTVGAHGKKKTGSFKVRVENVAPKDGVPAQDGSKYPFALSPGFYVISDRSSMLFSAGKKAGMALESQAEDGNPDLFTEALITKVGSAELGSFKIPVGSEKASPIFTGGAFEFTFLASEGKKLNLATMFGQSNDLFYAPDTAIELFDKDGNPLNGDISDLFKLWDAGTEVNQAPGLGFDQGPRQKGPNTGAAEKGVVRLVNDGFSYPDTKNVLRVTITAE